MTSTISQNLRQILELVFYAPGCSVGCVLIVIVTRYFFCYAKTQPPAVSALFKWVTSVSSIQCKYVLDNFVALS